VALRGTNQEFGRPYNRRIVLEAIRVGAPISRADLARQVGLSFQTVTTITRELEHQGFVSGSHDAPKGRGHPPMQLAINPDGGYALGLHLTPVSLEGALVNLAGALVGRRKAPLARTDPKKVFREIGTLVRDLRALKPKGRMLGVGLVLPGPFEVEPMSFVGPTTLEGWQDVPIQDWLVRETDLPAFVDVDVTAAALGEKLYGAGVSFRDFYYLYFGVGLGGSMVHDGQPLRGAHGNAVEIGHLPLVPGGELCPCGNRGCLELYLSSEALERRIRRDGKAAVEAWIRDAAPLLASAVVTIENLFDPQTIVVGGFHEHEVLARLVEAAEPLPNSIAVRSDRRTPRVILSQNGPDAILRGAAALAVSGVLSPRFGLLFSEAEAKVERDPIMLSPAEVAA
jgi:predicted NBD/HSP70 family sugar kinase